MSKKTIIIFIAIIIFTVSLTAGYFIQKRIKMDPKDHGNTASNLHNYGLFFEMDGKVYFANSSDNNCLYSMNLDESSPKRYTSMAVKYINGANDHLYFYMDSTQVSNKVKGLGSVTNQYGLYRCKINGSEQTCLSRGFYNEVVLCGEYLYFQDKLDGGTLNKIRVDKKNESRVADEYISPVCYDDGVIYYTGVTNDHNIHIMRTQNGDRTQEVILGHLFFPVVQNGYLYYLNGDSNYSLWRTNLLTGVQELVTSDRIDFYAVNDQYVYYAFSNADAPSLKRCNLDGSNTVVLFEGVVNSINLTSRYVYFKRFGDDTTTFHMPIDGSAPASVFEVKAN